MIQGQHDMKSMYDKTQFFNNYFARATEKQIVVDSFNNRLDLKEHSNILDLGCHNGGLMSKLFGRYHYCIPDSVNIVGVDPSQVAIDEYLTRDFAKALSVRGIASTAEAYFAQYNEHFDWIIASQCLYWSPDLNKMIQQIDRYSQKALIVLRGKHGIYEIQSEFKELLGNKHEQLYVCDDVEAALIGQDIEYSKEYHATDILLPDPNDEAFDWLIAFFLQVTDGELSNETLCRVKEFIINKSQNNTLRHDITLFWFGKKMV